MDKLKLPAYVEIRPDEFVSIKEIERSPEMMEQAVELAIKELDGWHKRYRDFFRHLGRLPAGRAIPKLNELIDAGAAIALLLKTTKRKRKGK